MLKESIFDRKDVLAMQKFYSDIKIDVAMFGEFSITIDGHQLTNLKGRTKRVWMLIQYLIANRHKELTLDNIVEVLWEDNECGDPLNALKNLIYRARALLKELSGNDRLEFIKYEHNTYAWNNSFDCTVDSELFEQYCKQGRDISNSAHVRIENMKKALALYKGEFLPKSSYSSWVISSAAYYSALYNECVIKLCGLLIEEQRFAEIVEICEIALKYAPFEEAIHKMLLYGYISMGQRGQALDHYNEVVDLFYRELGVDITDSLRPIYKQLINSINHIEIDLSVINNDLREAAAAEGAFYCDYDVFKSIYRVQARTILRTGQSIYILLFTLTDPEGAIPQPEVAKVAVSRLKDSILYSLRKGDVVSSFSATQFIVMLPVITYENAQKVADRILQKFHFSYRKDNVTVSVRINPVDSVI